MSVLVRIGRLLAPYRGSCLRCRRPWRSQQDPWWRRWCLVEPHSTPYDEGRGCFPLCTTCWADLESYERLVYYDQLVDWWIAEMPASMYEYEAKRVLIRSAVLEGL